MSITFDIATITADLHVRQIDSDWQSTFSNANAFRLLSGTIFRASNREMGYCGHLEGVELGSACDDIANALLNAKLDRDEYRVLALRQLSALFDRAFVSCKAVSWG